MSLSGEDGERPVLLIVGDLDGWKARGRDLPNADGLHFVGFGGLDARQLSDVMPDIVLSALLADDFDVIDLARRLESLGFAGRYRALASGVPQPDLIRREVNQHAPELDFDILMIDEDED